MRRTLHLSRSADESKSVQMTGFLPPPGGFHFGQRSSSLKPELWRSWRRRRQCLSCRQVGVGRTAVHRGRKGDADNRRLYFATCARGLGDVLEAELLNIGIDDIVNTAASGVSFRGSTPEGYRAALRLRTATRVLESLAVEESDTSQDVYYLAKRAVDWPRYLVEGQSFSVKVRSSEGGDPVLRTRIKDALCDVMVQRGYARPPPPRSDFDNDNEEIDSSASDQSVLMIVATWHRGRLELFRDLGGVQPLHKRGYRHGSAVHRSALNECAAASVALRAGVRRGGMEDGASLPPILDPMCGSATLLVETALIALDIAPGLLRSHYSLRDWPDCDDRAWIREFEQVQSLPLKAKDVFSDDDALVGNDLHGGSIALARRTLRNAGLDGLIRLEQYDIDEFQPSRTPGVVICNPPWGRRLSGEESVGDTWTKLSRFLKQSAPNAEAYILSGDAAVTSNLRMKASRRWPMRLGDVDCRLLRYHILPPKPTEGRSPQQISAPSSSKDPKT